MKKVPKIGKNVDSFLMGLEKLEQIPL